MTTNEGDEELEEVKPEFGEPRKLAADSDRIVRMRDKLAEAQQRADSVANSWGERAPRPLDGEGLRAYRIRLLKNYKHNSADYKEVPLEQLRALPPAMFDVAEKRIYADSLAASARPTVAPGYLRAVKRADEAGRVITTYFGEPRVWMAPFSGPVQRVSRIFTPRD
jgi:hypothetical protein